MLRDNLGSILLAKNAASHLHASLLEVSWALEELLKRCGNHLPSTWHEVQQFDLSDGVASWQAHIPL